MVEKNAPFRADHVGSLLRPPELLRAREQHQKGTLSAESLRAIENRCIRAVAKLQEEIGLQGITDGEYRRTIWHADFLREIDGVGVKEGVAESGAVVRNFSPGIEKSNAHPRSFISPARSSAAAASRQIILNIWHLSLSRTAKLCIPSPTILHMRGGRDAIDKQAYPDMDSFYGDLAHVYREEIRALSKLGCTYLQLDDPNHGLSLRRKDARERAPDRRRSRPAAAYLRQTD